MPNHDIVVIGASAGGLPALTAIVEHLPATLPAAVLVVMHTRANANGLLPSILGRKSALPVAFASEREALTAGRIVMAPPDFHLIVADGGVRVVHGPRENGFRPAIDPLFRTAARSFGSRVVGVVLSGALSDGVYGLSVIKRLGGVAIVQDPREAIVASMPRHAINSVVVDYVLRTADIAGTIARLAATPVEGGEAMPPLLEPEPQFLPEGTRVREMEKIYGSASSLTCPDCGGALWEVENGGLLRYQCHVGHQYAPENLEAGQRDAIDAAMWSAVRVLEEHVELKSRMARRADANGLSVVADGFEEGARDARRQAQQIREVLLSMDAVPAAAEDRERPARSAARSVAARVKSTRRSVAATRNGKRGKRRQ